MEHPPNPQTGPFPQFTSRSCHGLIRCCLQEEFEGEIIHSFQYTTAKKYAGKKVVVVGTATSGHDVAFDLANHGVGQYPLSYARFHLTHRLLIKTS